MSINRDISKLEVSFQSFRNIITKVGLKMYNLRNPGEERNNHFKHKLLTRKNIKIYQLEHMKGDNKFSR